MKFYVIRPALICFGYETDAGRAIILDKHRSLKQALQDSRAERRRWVAEWPNIDDSERQRWLGSYVRRFAELGFEQAKLTGIAFGNDDVTSTASHELRRLENPNTEVSIDETQSRILSMLETLLEQMEN